MSEVSGEQGLPQQSPKDILKQQGRQAKAALGALKTRQESLQKDEKLNQPLGFNGVLRQAENLVADPVIGEYLESQGVTLEIGHGDQKLEARVTTMLVKDQFGNSRPMRVLVVDGVPLINGDSYNKLLYRYGEGSGDRTIYESVKSTTYQELISSVAGRIAVSSPSRESTDNITKKTIRRVTDPAISGLGKIANVGESVGEAVGQGINGIGTSIGTIVDSVQFNIGKSANRRKEKKAWDTAEKEREERLRQEEKLRPRTEEERRREERRTKLKVGISKVAVGVTAVVAIGTAGVAGAKYIGEHPINLPDLSQNKGEHVQTERQNMEDKYGVVVPIPNIESSTND